MKRDNVVSTQSFPKDREIAAFSRAVIPLQRGPVTRRVFSSRALRQYTFIKDPKLAAGGKLAQTGNDKLTEKGERKFGSAYFSWNFCKFRCCSYVQNRTDSSFTFCQFSF